MSRRTHQITSESLLGLRFSERLALEMITTVLWPLHTDERIGLLLTTLADNVVDVAETDEEIDAIVERLRFHFKMEMHRHEKPSAKDNATDSRMLAQIRALLVQMPAKQARGRLSSSANQMSPPSALLNSLNELNGTTQRFSTPSYLVQCLLFTLRMLVVPPSGSIRSSSLKSTGLPLASSFCARFLVASISTCCDDGMPHSTSALFG
jgi:hypothetical protein